jgi:hypothetical protein
MLCSRCKKPHEEITKWCDPCKEKKREYSNKNKEKARQYYEDNRKKELERARQYRENNPDYQRQYYEANREDIRERDRQYYEANRENILERGRQYREENIEDIRERNRQYYEANRENILKRDRQYIASVHGTFMKMRQSARRRDIIFELTEDFVGNETDKPCFYCGEETTNTKRNGLDRLDNDIGYIPTNVVSCCWTCNQMKSCLDPTTFIERCSQISLHNGYKGKITENWDTVKGMTYAKYKKLIKRDIEITKDHYDTLRNGNCTYCGRSAINGHMNGIDRVNNNIGYTLENCVSCCGDCNFAKHVSTSEDFIMKCVLISSREHNIPEGIERQVKMFQKRK